MKQKILLCWGYSRRGWIEPFLKLSNAIDFEFLSYLDRTQDQVMNLDFPRHYWKEFESAQELLDKVRPDKIVFMSLDTGYSITLNIIAKNRGIPTFIAQHGVYHDYAAYLHLENESRKQGGAKVVVDTAGHSVKDTLYFIKKSLLPAHPLAFFRAIRFLLKKRNSIQRALKNYSFKGMRPTKYIAFTHFNNRIHYQREGISPSDTLLTGNYYIDDFFSFKQEELAPQEQYYLLIDQPLAENQYYDYGVPKEIILEFYQKLQAFAKSRGRKLKVKLHPESYKLDFFRHLEAIEFIEDADVTCLIMNAAGCLGTFSTILIPAILLKPCCLFELIPTTTFDAFKESGLAQILPFKTFKPEEILMEQYHKPAQQLEVFTDKFLYKADGRSLQRLQNILIS